MSASTSPRRSTLGRSLSRLSCAAATALAMLAPSAHAAWEPTKPVEFVIPAGTGGGADQMARLIQGIIVKHKLMKESMVVVNKAGGAGAEGFLSVKESKGDPHKIIITLSNLFTTPMATGVPFSWKDLTPVAMLALDQFVLWVPADTPYKTAKDYIDAVKAGDDKSFKMGGTGSKQEDQIITVALEKLTAPKKFTYIPYAGGGAVAVQLVGKHVNSSVNNPIEAVSQWKAGALKPLTDEERVIAASLRTHVAAIASREHNFLKAAELEAAARYIEQALAGPGRAVQTRLIHGGRSWTSASTLTMLPSWPPSHSQARSRPSTTTISCLTSDWGWAAPAAGASA